MVSNRNKIEQKCKELGLQIISLTYNPAIKYETGGWDLTVKDEDNEEQAYGAHSAEELIDDLEREWEGVSECVPFDTVCCRACSAAGGADRPVYHAAPACKEN